MNYVIKQIELNENLPFSFENQFKRFSYITFLPIQANGSIDADDKNKFWFILKPSSNLIIKVLIIMV